VKCIAADYNAMNLVEDLGFKELMEFAFPNYVMPSVSYITKCMEQQYYEEIKNLKLILEKELTYFVCTTDGWSSSNSKHHFSALTILYINSNWILNTYTLGLHPTRSKHSENLCEFYEKMFFDWDLSKKNCVCFVTDNEASIVKSCRLFKVDHLGNVEFI
jgi:hypothetical protein